MVLSLEINGSLLKGFKVESGRIRITLQKDGSDCQIENGSESSGGIGKELQELSLFVGYTCQDPPVDSSEPYTYYVFFLCVRTYNKV